MKKNTIKIILRALISIAILGFLLYKIDLTQLKTVLSNFNPAFYLLGIIILIAYQFILAYAWKAALSEKNILIKQKNIFRAIITSCFFAAFLPSSIGADLVLTFNIGKSLPQKEHAPSSFLFIRILGFSSSLFVAGIALMFIAHNFALRQVMVLMWVALLAIWICFWIAIHPKARRIVEKLATRFKWLSFIYKMLDSFSSFGKDRKIVLKIWLIGLVMVFLKTSIDYFMARSLGLNLPYIWFLALVPSISIITLLPISIAGLGVREGAYVGLFKNMGVPAASSFSISIMLFSLNIVLGIIGGILYLIYGTHVKSKHLK